MPFLQSLLWLIAVIGTCGLFYWGVMEFVSDEFFRKVVKVIVIVVVGVCLIWWIYFFISGIIGGGTLILPTIRR